MLSPDFQSKSGTLVLVVGPSGSGKDSLIARAKSELQPKSNYVFPKRVITRAAVPSAEDHDTMTEHEFNEALAMNRFALHWQAHGLFYGIRREYIDDMRNGQTIIINVSRGVIPSAEQLGFPVVVLSILCRPELLAERIAARGRESKDDILARLKREAPIAATSAKLVEIRNETTIDEAASHFIAAIREA